MRIDSRGQAGGQMQKKHILASLELIWMQFQSLKLRQLLMRQPACTEEEEKAMLAREYSGMFEDPEDYL